MIPVINNAGFGLNDLFADMPLERIQGMMQLNMVALTELCHAVLPAMRQRKQGRIMNIASIAAFKVAHVLPLMLPPKLMCYR